MEEERQPGSLLRKAAFYALVFFCVFIPFREPIASLTFSGVKALTDLVSLTVFVWYSVKIRFHYRFYLQDGFFLAFLGTAFISTIFLNHAGIGVYLFQVRSIGMYYLFYFTIRNFGYGKKEFLRILRVLQIVCLPLFALGLVEKISHKTLLFPIDIAMGIGNANYTRVYGMFYNPNTYGLFITITIFLSLAARVFFGAKTNPFLYAAMVFSLWLTMSRSSLLILLFLAVVLLLALILRGRIKEVWKPLLLCGAIVLGVTVALHYATNAAAGLYEKYVIDAPEKPSPGEDSGEQIEDTDGKKPGKQPEKNPAQQALSNKLHGLSQSDQNQGFIDRLGAINDSTSIGQSEENGRVFSVKTALKVLGDHPILGAGFGSYGSAASLNRTDSPVAKKYGLPQGFYSDIEYAKVVAENGVVGVLLFAAFLLSILWQYRKDPFKLAFCVMIGWFGLFFNIFEVQIGAMLFWSMLAFQRFDPAKSLLAKPAGRAEKKAKKEEK